MAQGGTFSNGTATESFNLIIPFSLSEKSMQAQTDPLSEGAFFYTFRPGGPNDFKSTQSPIFDAYGNVMYGAAGTAVGLSAWELQGAADAWHGGTNNPINTGDIQTGINAFNSGGVLVVIPPGN